MDQNEYYKLLIEQYKIMVGSTEKVTDQRQKANAFFLTVVTTLISISILIGKAFEFTFVAMIFFIALTVLNITIVDFWGKTIVSYGKLNKGKFVLIFELEQKLKANLFEREWEILTNRDNINYTPTTQTELEVVQIFKYFTYIMLIGELSYVSYISYNYFFVCTCWCQ
jgi:hypothetical protein